MIGTILFPFLESHEALTGTKKWDVISTSGLNLTCGYGLPLALDLLGPLAIPRPLAC